MQVVTGPAEARCILDEVRCSGRSVGFVPTMGAFHEGHLSLIRRSVAENDFTAVSNFVNPLQFAPTEDFDRYPRDLPEDNRLCEAEGADLVFAPSDEEMFARPPLVSVHMGELATILEGAHREGHLIGVGTIVSKLFSIVGPCRAYFGEKDWQQLTLVRRMAEDLSLPVNVVGCPIVREPDGLALSSRNRYLSEQERADAGVLSRALRHGIGMIEAGESDPRAVAAAMEAMIEPVADKLGYATVVLADSLQVPDSLPGSEPLRLLVAAHFGNARLIDNMGYDPAQPAA